MTEPILLISGIIIAFVLGAAIADRSNRDRIYHHRKAAKLEHALDIAKAIEARTAAYVTMVKAETSTSPNVDNWWHGYAAGVSLIAEAVREVNNAILDENR